MAKTGKAKAAEQSISGKRLLDSIAKSLGRDGAEKVDDRQLAELLGINFQTMGNWRAQSSLKPSMVANMVAKAVKAAKSRTERETLNPVVEFYPLEPVQVGKDEHWEMFSSTTDGQTGPHPYRAGLRAALEKSKGIYVFYDSRGRVLYVGKTVAQSLWTEMNYALNRPRGKQLIRRVIHPKSKIPFASTNETRQIGSVAVELHELACYCSAYKVSVNLIGELESLLIRGFANDLSNVKMEKFGGGLQESDKPRKAKKASH